MSTSLRVVVAVVGFSSLVISATPVSANTFQLKCDAQKDAVWVYDSLTSLNVQAKLSCGQDVEVVDRADGYAKIRAANGVVGYIPETDFANLPGFQARHDAAQDVGASAKAAQAKEIAEYNARKNAFAGAPPVSSNNSAALNASAKASAPAGVASYQLAEMASRPAAPAAARPTSTAAAISAPANLSAAQPAATVVSRPAAPKITVTEVPTLTSRPNFDESPTAAVETVDTTKPLAPTAAKTSDAAASSMIGDGSCRAYFSAYGLTTAQLKWIEQNRSKEFASVCPAPDLAHVNFVIIFTHDVDFYSVTMPNRVHNGNGFSDFSPMTTVDNALMSSSDASKARHEYVWVFQFSDGGFNPDTFSPRRASQFAKEESNGLGGRGSQKTVEDAFRYVEGANR
jgi:hypothetical protein